MSKLFIEMNINELNKHIKILRIIGFLGLSIALIVFIGSIILFSYYFGKDKQFNYNLFFPKKPKNK